MGSISLSNPSWSGSLGFPQHTQETERVTEWGLAGGRPIVGHGGAQKRAAFLSWGSKERTFSVRRRTKEQKGK